MMATVRKESPKAKARASQDPQREKEKEKELHDDFRLNNDDPWLV